MSKSRVWLLLVLCNLFWAGNFVFGKFVVAEMPPISITFTRWLFASIILIGIAHFIEKPKWNTVFKEWPSLTGLAILGIVGYNSVLYYALNFTSPTNASLVNSFNPGLIAVASAIYLREKIPRIQVLGILVSFLGVFVIMTKGNLLQIFATQYNKGDLLMIGAIIMWTLYSMISKKLTTIPPITSTAVSGLIAVILMAPFAIAQGIDYAKLSTIAVTGIAYITIFPTICSFIFWNIGVREIGVSKAGVFLNLNPVFTAVISLALGQKITIVQVLGGLLVFLGVYITTGMFEKNFIHKSKF
ncbi:MAG TPA: DMT family transporter [Clostridia bacterium]|nr:DMT family transporter [Clostridia bacterium]